MSYLRSRGGRRKVLFGSNHPMIAPAKALDALDALELDEETSRRFLGENAQDVFSLERPMFADD